MKTNTTLRRLLLLGTATGAALLLLSAAPAQAASTYHASINTTALAANTASGPYYLDFSLSNASVTNNTVMISNLILTGGTLTGSAAATGGATGSFGGTVTLNDTAFFNDIYQGFTQGTTGISFDVTTTTNVDSINSSDPTDIFSFTVLDNGLNNITTSHADGVSLFTQAFDSLLHDTGSFANSSPATGTGDFAGVTVSSVPEPSRAMLLFGGLGALVFRRRRA